MTKTEMKKASLINFIKYKMEHGGDTKEEIDKVMKMAKKMLNLLLFINMVIIIIR